MCHTTVKSSSPGLDDLFAAAFTQTPCSRKLSLLMLLLWQDGELSERGQNSPFLFPPLYQYETSRLTW